MELDVSLRLCSLGTLAQVRRELDTQVAVRVMAVTRGVATIHLRPRLLPQGIRPSDLFREALTRALMEESQPKLRYKPGDRRRPLDVIIKLTRPEGRTRILLGAALTSHSPAAIFTALAELRDRAWISLESTNPVDRLVTKIDLFPGESVGGAIQTIVLGLENDEQITIRPGTALLPKNT